MSAGTESSLHGPPRRTLGTFIDRNVASPRTGAASAPVNHDSTSYLPPRTVLPSPANPRHFIAFPSTPTQRSLLKGQLSSQSLTSSPHKLLPPLYVPYSTFAARRGRASSIGNEHLPVGAGYKLSPGSSTGKSVMSVASASLAKARARSAQKENDAMVYLDGSQIYTCGQCRTHLTSHDDIISKSFHGRHGRAYLFDQCVNVTIGKAEDRALITGLHSVCDIFCKRCKTQVGWTYARAYEASQKYKEKKFIIEKMFIQMEDSPNYDIIPAPAGERSDRWRRRSMSWGTESSASSHSSPGGGPVVDMVYEYHPPGSM